MKKAVALFHVPREQYLAMKLLPAEEDNSIDITRWAHPAQSSWDGQMLELVWARRGVTNQNRLIIPVGQWVLRDPSGYFFGPYSQDEIEKHYVLATPGLGSISMSHPERRHEAAYLDTVDEDEQQNYQGLFVDPENAGLQEYSVSNYMGDVAQEALDIRDVVFDTYQTSLLDDEPRCVTVVATHSPSGLQAEVESYTLSPEETKGRAFAKLEERVLSR